MRVNKHTYKLNYQRIPFANCEEFPTDDYNALIVPIVTDKPIIPLQLTLRDSPVLDEFGVKTYFPFDLVTTNPPFLFDLKESFSDYNFDYKTLPMYGFNNFIFPGDYDFSKFEYTPGNYKAVMGYTVPVINAAKAFCEFAYLEKID